MISLDCVNYREHSLSIEQGSWTVFLLTAVQQAATARPSLKYEISEITELYEGLPKGPAPKAQPKGLWQRYQHRYFGENESPART